MVKVKVTKDPASNASTSAPKKMPTEFGPNGGKEQQIANSLLQQAERTVNSQRGKGSV